MYDDTTSHTRPSVGSAPATHQNLAVTSTVGWRRWQTSALMALTAYSTALGWQAQQVSYPLFRAVAPGDFAAYHEQYNDSIPWVVVVPGFVGFLGATAFWWTRPNDVSRPLAALVSLTGLTCILTTVAWAIPMHNRLDALGQSDATIDSLLQANLVRTLALTASTVALAWCSARSRTARSSTTSPNNVQKATQ